MEYVLETLDESYKLNNGYSLLISSVFLESPKF